ncbi:hypothetical protein Cni_G02670 [Canna indica]|uniref:GDP-fucose protein O-fucosyltransferase 2 n=1 Tax=Canna indica TaxID=4628 RepID=A0AAQ3Q2K1_9LILI|nr:hypothetical protein Cni_G02670 [Canna indica]
MARIPIGNETGIEKEEHQTLFTQNGSRTSSPRSALEIGHLPTLPGCFSGRRCLFLSFSISLLLVLIFFLFSRNGVDSSLDRMRESELRALYLLRNQQAGLLNLWNRTRPTAFDAAAPSPSFAPSPASKKPNQPNIADLDELESALFEQIKLNKQIQNALLSSHATENSSSAVSDDNADLEMFGSTIDPCEKVNRTASRRTIEWKPKKDRFLFAICLSGQMSNHLICLEKHMFFAALLDRVLILPGPDFDYQYDEVLDIGHINECFGRQVVITFDHFTRAMKNKTKIDRFICYIASPPCYMDEEHVQELKNLGLSLAKIEAAWPEDAKSKTPKKRVVGEIMHKFSSSDEVIAIGDMFYADVEEEWVMQPGGPLSHKCKTVIQPSKLIYLTAERFVQTFMGGNFVALHFRRHGFLKFCNLKKQSCFFPIPQAAECILRVLEKAGAEKPVIYLSTDAGKSEVDLLRSLVVLNGKPVPLIRRPAFDSAEKWDAILYRNNLGGDSQVEAMLDKTICALSTVFIGSSGSTFTEDIIRLRRGWGSASKCDEYLCQGEQPNYIAENI